MRKTTAKAMAALLALVMVLSLAGCGHEHTWADATCTTPKTCTECGKTEGEVLAHDWQEATCAAPKTCSLCGETEGEALPHTWEDATCAAPKTCSVCGETEGETLPHTWREANFQSPQTCTVCGETEGDVLTPAFESDEVDTSKFQPAELNETYEYHGISYIGHNLQQTGHVTFYHHEVFSGDDAREPREGYEWHVFALKFLSDDPSVETMGRRLCYNVFDYYTGVSMEQDTFTVNYNGTDYECQSIFDGVSTWDTDSNGEFYYAFISVQVPVGYDGIVVTATDLFSEEDYNLFIAGEGGLADCSGHSLRYMRSGA